MAAINSLPSHNNAFILAHRSWDQHRSSFLRAIHFHSRVSSSKTHSPQMISELVHSIRTSIASALRYGRQKVKDTGVWLSQKLSNQSFDVAKESLTTLLAQAGDQIPRGISLARDIGVMTLERVREFAVTVIEFIKSQIPSATELLDTIMSTVFDSLARVALEQVKFRAQQLFDKYKTWTCATLLVIICVCYVAFPATQRSKCMTIFHFAIDCLMLYSKQYACLAVSTAIHGLVTICNTRKIHDAQGAREDFTRVFKSGLICASLMKLETAGIAMTDLSPANLERIMKRTVLVGRSMQMWDVIADRFGEFFDDLFSVVMKYVCGSDYISLRRVGEIDNFCSEVHDLISLKQSLKVGRDRKTCLKIESLYQRYLLLRTKHAGNRKALELLNTYGFVITDLYGRVVNKNPNAHTMRKEPLCIVFRGKSGVGKSYLMDTFKQALLKIADRYDDEIDADASIYSRCKEQEFWDGYTGQPIVVFDDFGQAVDTPANPNLEFFELIRAVNIFPWNLHSANLNEKANNPFNAEFILLTTNLPIMDPKSIISRDALLRRLHLTVEVDIIPEVRKYYRANGTDTWKLDVAKLAAYRARNALPAHDRSHWMFYQCDETDQSVNGGVMDYNQLVVKISHMYKHHQDSYDERQRNAETTREEALPLGAFSKSGRWTAEVGFDDSSEDSSSVSSGQYVRYDQPLWEEPNVQVIDGVEVEDIPDGIFHDAEADRQAYYIELNDWLANSIQFRNSVLQMGIMVAMDADTQYGPSDRVWDSVEEYNSWFWSEEGPRSVAPNHYVFFDRAVLQRAIRDERRGAQPFSDQFFRDNAQRFSRNDDDTFEQPCSENARAFQDRRAWFSEAGSHEEREATYEAASNAFFRGDSFWSKIGRKLFYAWFKFHCYTFANDRVIMVMRWVGYVLAAVTLIMTVRSAWNFAMGGECPNHLDEDAAFWRLLWLWFRGSSTLLCLSFAKYYGAYPDLIAKLERYSALIHKSPFLLQTLLLILRHTALHKRYHDRCKWCVYHESQATLLSSHMEGDAETLKQCVADMNEEVPPVEPEMTMWNNPEFLSRQFGVKVLPDGQIVDEEAWTEEHTSSASDESRKRPVVDVEHTSTASDEARKRPIVEVEHTSSASDEARKRPPVDVEYARAGDFSGPYTPLRLDTLEKMFETESGRASEGSKKNRHNVEAPYSTQATELIGKLKRHIVLLYFKATASTGEEVRRYLGQCFVVRGHRALINKHYIAALPGICAEARRLLPENASVIVKLEIQLPGFNAFYEGDIRSIVERSIPVTRGDNATDFKVWQLPKAVPARPDALSHFITKAKLAKIQRNTRMFLPVWRKVGKMMEFMIREGLYKASEDIDLRTAGGMRKYRNSGTIQISSEAGDCGSPYVVNDNLYNEKIVGFHFGGAAGEGSFSFITREDIAPLVGEEIYDSDGEHVAQMEKPDEFPLDGAFDFLGKIPHKMYQPTKSNKVPSVIFEEVAPTTVAPSKICAPLTPNGPMINGLLKNKDPSILLDDVLLEQATMSFKQIVGLCVTEATDRRVGTFEEGCIGRPGDQAYPPLKRSKGAGYPYCTRGSKGKQLWLGDSEWNLSRPEALALRSDVEALIGSCKRGIIPEALFTDTLKDETRPIEKVKAGKTRVFSAAPLHLSIALRMYFGGWLAFNYRNRVDIEACVGVDARAPAVRSEWTKMARKMEKYGEGYVVAGDFSNFDGTLNYYIFDKVREVINDWYMGTKEETLIRDVLWRTIIQSKHILSDFVYMFSHGQPSGNNTTAVTNSNYVSIATRYNYALTFGHCKDFNDCVQLLAYGDDSLIHVAPRRAEEWSPKTIARNFTYLGMNFTNETKGEMTDVFRPLSDVNFLKRQFVWCSRANMYMAPLAMQSIIEMTNWVTREIPPLQATRDNCEDALLELYHHDEATYNEMSARIRMALLKHDIYLPTLPWRTARSMISTGTLSQCFQIETVRV